MDEYHNIYWILLCIFGFSQIHGITWRNAMFFQQCGQLYLLLGMFDAIHSLVDVSGIHRQTQVVSHES